MIDAGRHTIVPEDLLTHVPVSIGAFCSIASGCRVASGQHPGVVEPNAISDFPFNEHGWGDYPVSDMGEGVTIGNDAWIGQEVMILDRVTIGDGARIGAGTVVTQEVPAYCVVAGNPARFVRLRFSGEQVEALKRISWWKWTDTKIESALPFMRDVGLFIDKYDKGE